jgi:hypothetical protein
MAHSGGTTFRPARMLGILATAGLIAVLAAADPSTGAQPKKKTTPRETKKPVANPPPRSAMLTNEAWRGAPVSPVTSEEIDVLVGRELRSSKVEPAPLTTDEQFIRRVSLDLTGRLPTPVETDRFVSDRDGLKRPKLIDRLLASDAFARHWARYWRDVFVSKIVDRRGLILSRSYEEWMFEQLKANKGWADIARAMITAEGQARYDEPGKNGAAFFLLSHLGADAANDRAAETSRVFLGIQIRCAQCHDHPFDQWKQVQFHELAAYYARTKERPVRGDPANKMRITGMELVAAPRGEHEMAVKNDPSKTFTTHPRFLDGKVAGRDLGDQARRQTLASAIVDKNNYWFAGAYVNRTWGALMGQSFYQPVDDMGPEREAVFGNVLVRLASSFRATNYDIREMFRVILNSRTYQRQIRPGESADEHLHFAASYPTQLPADALWQSLTIALGLPAGAGQPKDNPKAPAKPGPGMARFGFAGQFQQLFGFDPSLKADEVEANIAQALMMMNNAFINQRIEAKGESTLAKILKDNAQDDDALKTLYQRTLARKPTSSELEKCRKHIKKVGNRSEAFEDIFWALLNSTEFKTKR